ncbi:hypothetical protein BEL04_18200 [Mucilaginibacter sp. PPCGB 2223]|uniref:hypothetical protein n=1 Tax=Mucilaginibacter sp. PPCGB 2223 TaxID=1886027 RepID=UPI000826DD94|nr:hypothetical protein [Mucilaginibacter sp. PPCGB 2223]OCX51934.1 hypothetical protein BEL04_18200 [Mucilaginibacter sp. PPCGB 2223]
MSEEIKYEPLFPKQLEHLNKDSEQFKTQISAIDHELENAPKDEGPNPKNRPPGPEGYDTGMRGRRAQYLDSTRERRIKTYRSAIEKNISPLDAKEQQIILSRYDFETSKNGFKNYSKQNLKEVKSVTKEDKASFDFMAASYFSKYQQPEIPEAHEKENIDTWSERYIDMLNSYRNEEINRDIEKELEIEPQ